MAHLYPNPISPDTESDAEKHIYELFEKHLNDSFHIIHSASWIARQPHSGASDGETDFVIIHPARGILLLEVKGGEVQLEQINQKKPQWYSISKNRKKHEIKDPFKQVKGAKYDLVEKMKDVLKNEQVNKGNVQHAVAFPDVALTHALRPDAPREIILDWSQMNDNIQGAIFGIYEYWNGASGASNKLNEENGSKSY